MTDKKNTGSINRRTVVAAGLSALAAPAVLRVIPAHAQSKTIKIGHVSPKTGPLAGFGESDGFIIDQMKKMLGKGLSSGGKTYPVEIISKDSQSSGTRAAEVASELILHDKVDLLIASSAPDTTNPVADQAEVNEVPCVTTNCPWQPYFFGRNGDPKKGFTWTYHFFWGLEDVIASYLPMWDSAATNKVMGGLFPNDADGNAIRQNLAPGLAKAGFTIIDPGPYEDGTTDYSAQISTFKKEKCEIFNTFPIPPDFAAFWRQAAQQGYTKIVKIAQIAKTGLFPAQVESLGDLGYNLATACYWHKTFPYKSSLTGISGVELADGYEKASGKQWTQQLGASMALFDAGIAALKASANPKDKAAVAKALGSLNTVTMCGKVDFTSGPVANVSPGPIIGCQWLKSKPGSKFKLDFAVVENATDPNVPVAAKLVAYNQK